MKRVYATVAVQLAATAVLAAPISTASKYWLQAHSSLLLYSTLGFVALSIGLVCGGQDLLRRHPWNIIILAGFTSLESVSVGFFCARYEAASVLWCIGITAAIAASLTFVALATKMDLSSMGGYLSAASLACFCVGLLGVFLHVPGLQLLYSMLGGVLASAYIVYDTQLILGGKHQVRCYSIDDYVLAALALYMDLIRLFLFILRLFGKERKERR